MLLLLVGQGLSASSGIGTIETDNAVAVVDLKGEIISSKTFVASLEKAVKNEKVNGVVVHIDSPGGSVGASEEMYRAIVKASEKKPVMCALSNVAASGGLYAAVACERIFVNKGTLTGSIGVIMMTPDLSEITQRYGVSMNVVKSGKFKDAGSPFRSFDPADRKLLQDLVDSAYEQFVGAIATSRKLSVEAVKKFADGRIILGENAIELGLVDEVGGLPEAALAVLRKAKPDSKDDPEIIMPPKPSGLSSMFDDVAESKLFAWLSSWGEARLLYRAFL